MASFSSLAARGSRPFAIAFAIFITLNLALALQDPRLPVTAAWLDAGLPEPALSLFAGLLGAALILPHDLAAGARLRWLLGGTFAGFGLLAAGNTAEFYASLRRGDFASDFPVPLSAGVFFLLASEAGRVLAWRPAVPVTPPPARFFLRSAAVILAFAGVILAHLVTFGHQDRRRTADAAVILGARVEADGKPCAALVERLETGIELYRQGLVKRLIMSGGKGPNGVSEPAAMKEYAVRRGIPGVDIIPDERGLNTRASAAGAHAIARELGLRRLLAVTQYFHCARVKLVFEREGTPCDTVPTCSRGQRAAPAGGLAASRAQGQGPQPPPSNEPGAGRLAREGYFLLREVLAFPFYLIYYR